ncbi:methyltransferase type 11 [Micromonospora globispora]|uniref:Methyltransferase type 11 n=1 Tax=Micromonospora globispora TaxID=1450148 RepID=A0A317KCP4_9ACTN|nr:class I SAM-dependent methyltransferase [Micromonospora globispora]PWU50637.1 methyltransferase type 11 [Micromonospora globispora]PWU59845.1 methyltransferase type 11 [Micromonospora globispora]RQX05148.1 methyltransferase type 11 [Micromonospora globispora]
MSVPIQPSSAARAKACCAATYGSDVVALLLGDSYHPGGLALTRRLADRLDLRAGARVLDVASGRGTTALTLATEYEVDVTGVELSDANVALATGAAQAAGLADRIRFQVGDAERLPVDAGSFDVVVCECAFCTFPDKPTAAAELARVLRPGGRLGITDVTVEADRLPPELTGLGASIACIGDARPVDEYHALLTTAGLRVTRIERHDTTIAAMIDQIEARLTVMRMTARARAEALGVDFDRAPAVLATARAAVADRVLGYALLTATKPR